MAIPIPGDIHTCDSDGSAIPVDSLEHKCHYLFYGEFTR
jgi:hypothetical protein